MNEIKRTAYAYTPGIKIKFFEVIQKVRKLPIPGEVRVAVGDEVNAKTIIATTKMPGKPEILNAALVLGVEPEELLSYIRKKVGDKVKKNEIIAEFRALGGLIRKTVIAPVDGEIENISTITGQIVLRQPPVAINLNSYIPGKIVEVIPNFGAVVETKGAIVQGIFGLGGEKVGKLKIAVNQGDEDLTENMIGEDDKNKIVVGGSYTTYNVLKKANEIGVAGIIIGGVDEVDVVKLLSKEIGVAITGKESGLTLILTEGFGRMSMSKRTFELLKQFEDFDCSINGQTQIRAGVIRPEIIIPHSLEKEREKVEFKEEEGLTIGTPVRIIRRPYFGKIGHVSALPPELMKIETESEVRVLEVTLENGEKVMVPRANVEILTI
ncbi:MAG: hypothetical protein QXF82_05790 [Nitrososphaeria archaeon]